MSESDGIKPGEIIDAFEVIHFPKGDGFQWAKQPTHFPEQRLLTLYGIEVVDENGDPAPFIAHSTPFKNTLN